MLMVKRDRDRAFSQRCRSAPSYLVDRAAVVWVRRRGVGDGHANRRRAAIIAGRACWRVILVALLERENIHLCAPSDQRGSHRIHLQLWFWTAMNCRSGLR